MGRPGQVDGGGSGPHREGEVVSQSVGVEHLGAREHHVARPDPEHRPGVIGAGCPDIGVPVDHAFWPPRRPRAVQPKGHVVGMSGHRVDFARASSIQESREPAPSGASPLATIRLDLRSCCHLGPHHFEKAAVDDGDGGIRVVEEIPEVVGPGQEVDRNRHRPDPHRAEKGGREKRGCRRGRAAPGPLCRSPCPADARQSQIPPGADARQTRRRHRQ